MDFFIKQEPLDVYESPDSDEDKSEDETTGFDEREKDQDTDELVRPTSSRQSIHVSVQRENISAAHVQEGSEELQSLGVDVYDQHIYERSVFDQVDRAISDPSDPSGSKRAEDEPAEGDSTQRQSSSSINDLMRLIHDGNQDTTGTGVDDAVQARDEEILNLTRQQRLLKTRVKLEPSETRASVITLPRVPRKDHSNDTPVSNNYTASSKRTEIQTERKVIVKQELVDRKPSVLDEDLEGELSSISDDDSSVSEYVPTAASDKSHESDLDDLNEDIDYETDSELGIKDPFDDIEPESESQNGKRLRDDGDIKVYAARIKAYHRSRAKLRLENIDENGVELKKLDEMVMIDGNLRAPKELWDNLFEHQKTGVRWFWELHQLGTGGILGDEMGLGKTIQMIAFLVALRSSNIANAHNAYANLGPTVLVCPATVMHQWLQEFRKWYPPFRVAILHSTGTFSGDKKNLVKAIHKANGILICSYPGVIIYQDYLHALDWHYAILDEGHKIKNPDSQVTLACKRFRTPHRIILSGSPVQNNLRELWSIFDFIYPGKLGTLPVFLGQFAIPITQGGYANATDIQVQIAYKCACVLRDTIKPFLLRRTKAEVNSKLKLPERSEQVLFCKLTDKQRALYEQFLRSPTVRDIKRGALQIFVGLIQLRKICNHPDIFDNSECNRQIKQSRNHQETGASNTEFFSVDETYGHYKKSGKMMVVDALLKLWKKQGDKVLLFTQSRQMLNIFSRYLDERNYKYLSMDGTTPIGARHSLINKFNSDEEIFIFLLTTRVGGVGVNLIGANRIIIYDPDWNPSTDIQARERAWRIGQQRHVIIYRLLTAGTIEEKIYHRQVFKLYLTNRILKDAKQKRFFKTNDLHELFTLGTNDKNIETKALFDDDLHIDEKSIKRSKKKDKKLKKRKLEVSPKSNDPSAVENSLNTAEGGVKLSEEKLKEIRERAKKLSQMIALNYGGNDKSYDAGTSGGNLADASGSRDMQRSNFLDDTAALRPPARASVSRLLDSNENSSHTTLPQFAPISNHSASSELEPHKQHKDKSEKKKKKQLAKYLVKQDIYNPSQSETDKSESRESRYKRDDYILGRLFKNSNIFAALKHDRIESDTTSDFKVVESEAEKVARDAIRALKDSRRLCLGSTSGIPNWTGRNGQLASTSGSRLVPKNKSRAQMLARTEKSSFGSSSASSNNGKSDSILSSIKKRNQANPVKLDGCRDEASLDSDDEEATNRDFRGKAKEVGAEEMTSKIRDFVLHQSSTRGEAQTEEILEFFKNTFPPKKTAIFKAILYKLCEFHRRGDKGFWRLKSEFRDL